MVEHGLSPRSGTAFVEVDFNTTDLAAALRAVGFRDARPAVFSWLNVIYYLKWNAVLRTFETIHEFRHGGAFSGPLAELHVGKVPGQGGTIDHSILGDVGE